MSQVVILHGTAETPQSFWYPYLKNELESRDHSVFIPELPNTNNPKLSEQLDFVLKNVSFDEDSVVIGHSSGCPLILSVLENIPVVLKQAICVAGYATPLSVGTEDTINIKDSYDWDTIKKHCKEFIFINSVNDPWGANDKQGRIMFDQLGGMLIINNEGHMGSDSFNQPYKKFPLIVKLIT